MKALICKASTVFRGGGDSKKKGGQRTGKLLSGKISGRRSEAV